VASYDNFGWSVSVIIRTCFIIQKSFVDDSFHPGFESPQAIGCSDKVLDTMTSIGLIAVYSTRITRCGYTGYAIRLRRDSDNQECDANFNASGQLASNSSCTNTIGAAVTDLSTFKGTANLTVTKWYDQSGNSFDVDAPDPTKEITLLLNQLNGFAILKCNGTGAPGTGDYLLRNDAYGLTGNPAISVVTAIKSTNTYGRFFQTGAGNPTVPANNMIGYGVDGSYRYNGGAKTFLDDVQTNWAIASFVRDAATTYNDGDFYKNGIAIGVNAVTNGGLTPVLLDEQTTICAADTGSIVQDIQGEMTEILIFNKALSSTERSAIESEISLVYAFGLL